MGVAVAGWSGPGGHGLLSGPEASRGVSEGLATKEGWQQVGWGLTAVPCPVSGGWGHPAHLPAPSDLPCLSHGLCSPRLHPVTLTVPSRTPVISPVLSCVPQNVASSVRLGLRWRMLMEERREPSNPGSGEKTNCKVKAECLGPTSRVRGSLGAGEWRAGALSRVGAQGHLLTIRTRGLARTEQPLWVEIPRFTAQFLPDSSLSGFSSASQTLLSYQLENGETWAGS